MKSQITVHTCFALIASTFWFSCKDDSYVDEEERGEKTKKHFRDGVIFTGGLAYVIRRCVVTTISFFNFIYRT